MYHPHANEYRGSAHTPITMTSRSQLLSARYLFFIILMTGYFMPHLSDAKADPDLFPGYQAIESNITFWEKVYSTYSVNTAIIHDQDNLSRVYSTVALQDLKVPGSRKQNSRQIKQVKKYYASLLNALANKKKPVSPEEKRVAALFGAQHSPEKYREAAENIRAQTGLRERFSEGVGRSGAYMGRIKQIFRNYGLPEDLAYLPHVESSFNPNAFSKFGASGMWQFTRATGKEFMRIDYIIDERRDPIISADAAARLLKRNYKRLGSWPLALTAYNYGAAGMKRALNQEGSYVNIFKNYQKGYFKFASRNFYSEFLAAVRVAKVQERGGSVRFDKPLAAVAVKMPAYVNASKLCAYLGVSTDQLKHYNPSLRTPVFDGTKYIPQGHMLKLPNRFNNSSLLSGAPASIFSKSQKRSRFYQVRPGDTAGAIAAAHKIPLNNLIQANHLNGQGFIRVGQNLRIPSSLAPYTETQNVTPQQSTGIVLKDSKKSSPKPSARHIEENLAVSGNLKVLKHHKKADLDTGIVEVQPDESIGLFADWLKVTPEAIRLSNNITLNKDIYPGQKIVLEFLNVRADDFEALRFDFHQEIQEDFFDSYTVVDVTTYQVSNGDTIWDLCHKKFDLPLWLLKKYNDKLNFNRLELSSSLQVPVVKEI